MILDDVPSYSVMYSGMYRPFKNDVTGVGGQEAHKISDKK